MDEIKSPKKPLIFYYIIVMAILLLLNLFAVPKMMQMSITEVDYGTFMTMTENKEIGQVEIEDNQILFTDQSGDKIYKTGLMDDPGLTERLYDSGAKFSSEIVEQASPIASFLLTWVFPVVLFVVVGQLVSRYMMKKMGGGSNAMSFGMGKSNAKVYVKSTTGIKFADVAGEDEAKENLMEIVQYLHDPEEVHRHRHFHAQGHPARRPSRHR